MSYIDSPAVFEERATALGLGSHLEAMRTAGWRTPAAFAFSVDVNSANKDRMFTERVIIPLLGSETSPESPVLRQLYSESFTLAAAELKRKVERTGDEAPRELPRVERERRRDACEARLTGVRLEGTLDPGHSLIDATADMWETNKVEFIPWDQCPSRREERDEAAKQGLGAKKRRLWQEDARGYLQVSSASNAEAVADSSCTARLDYIFQRRGIALDINDVMTYLAHDKIRRRLMDALLEPQPDPRFEGPSLEQIKKADQHIWDLLDRACPKGIRRGASTNDLHVHKAYTISNLLISASRLIVVSFNIHSHALLSLRTGMLYYWVVLYMAA